MEVQIYPSKIEGKVTANASKSAMQRAVAAALLSEGSSVLYNPGKSNDCLAALDVAKKLGAEIQASNNEIKITSKGINPRTEEINCGESGLGIRMFTPIAALSSKPLTINGEGSLATRPLHFFEEVLPQLKVKCNTNDGKLPLHIKGPLQAKNITVDGSLSSQFLTGLLMAYGSTAENKTITVQNLTSKPYIELTLQVMRNFGVEVEHENLERFHFGTKQSYSACNYTVEGDWSGAAFLLVAGAVAGQIELTNLNMDSRQSDKAILQALKLAGAQIIKKENYILVKKNSLVAFDFDATHCPDLFPPLAALAANCKGTTKIKGAQRLTHKESNRSQALIEEFGKLGIKIEVEGDEMFIHGGTGISGGKVFSHNDHRIAMACAVAGLNTSDPITISGADAVNKSYPEFWEHLKKIRKEYDS